MTALRLLILETSGRRAQVAVAEGATLLAVRSLDEARRHARDLAPTVAELLAQQSWSPREVAAVIVSLGPGSYTGLRVGVMSAKTFAYATRCALVGVETFAAIATQAPVKIEAVDVIADAQKNNIYVQSFRSGVADPLRICPFMDWLAQRATAASVTGPGLLKWRTHLPSEIPVLEETLWEPSAQSLLQLGQARLAAGTTDNPLSLEPLYLRPSSAEEQWRDRSSC